MAINGQGLGRRDIIGQFFLRLGQLTAGWPALVSMLMESDQESEIYRWLGQTPTLREWVGGKHIKQIPEQGQTIINLMFEATLGFAIRDLRRDKTGQIRNRINGLAVRSAQHWGSLLSTAIINGATELCYDGQAFFDTDHVDPGAVNQTNQSNKANADISTFPGSVHGSTTNPSVSEAIGTALQAITAMTGYLDDQGEPMGEHLQNFICLAPTNLFPAFSAASVNRNTEAGDTNILVSNAQMNLTTFHNPRLNASNTVVYFFAAAADDDLAPFIRQVEVDAPDGGQFAGEGNADMDVKLKVLGEGSDHAFLNNEHLYSAEASRNVGYGAWQRGYMATLT